MTTTRQIGHVFKSVVARQADTVVIAGRFLWVKPIRHVARRVFIDRTSMADCAAPQWRIRETFLYNRNLVYEAGVFGFHYRRDPPGADEFYGKMWQWSDPTMVPHLVAMIETTALPFLRALDTLERYAACYRRIDPRALVQHPEDRMIVDIALGDLDAARTACLRLLPEYRVNRREDWALYQALRTQVIAVAEPLMDGDRAALAAILHGWEAANIRGTALEPHWEPTPFPLETA